MNNHHKHREESIIVLIPETGEQNEMKTVTPCSVPSQLNCRINSCHRLSSLDLVIQPVNPTGERNQKYSDIANATPSALSLRTLTSNPSQSKLWVAVSMFGTQLSERTSFKIECQN